MGEAQRRWEPSVEGRREPTPSEHMGLGTLSKRASPPWNRVRRIRSWGQAQALWKRVPSSSPQSWQAPLPASPASKSRAYGHWDPMARLRIAPAVLPETFGHWINSLVG